MRLYVKGEIVWVSIPLIFVVLRNKYSQTAIEVICLVGTAQHIASPYHGTAKSRTGWRVQPRICFTFQREGEILLSLCANGGWGVGRDKNRNKIQKNTVAGD